MHRAGDEGIEARSCSWTLAHAHSGDAATAGRITARGTPGAGAR